MNPYLGIGWQISELHGWGVFGINVIRELIKRGGFPRPRLFDDPVLDSVATQELAAQLQDWQRVKQGLAALGPGEALHLPDTTVLHAFGNDFTGPGSKCRVRGGRNVGFIFFEELVFSEPQLALGRGMDLMLAGSSWNAQVLREMGFANAGFVMQGVDIQRFQPRPSQGRFADRFVVFSGGKLEFRKGQDIVLAAFREFQRRHPEALLVTAWHNPWPAGAANIADGPHGLGAPGIDAASGQLDIGGWLRHNGLPEGSYIDVGFINNREFPHWYREVDVAVFPNRAEGGTNLVAMEVMASGVPCVLSANTGHLDLIDDAHCYALRRQTPLTEPKHAGWGESDPLELVERLEQVYQDRQHARAIGARGAEFIRAASWQAQTAKLLAAIDHGLFQ